MVFVRAKSENTLRHFLVGRRFQHFLTTGAGSEGGLEAAPRPAWGGGRPPDGRQKSAQGPLDGIRRSHVAGGRHPPDDGWRRPPVRRSSDVAKENTSSTGPVGPRCGRGRGPAPARASGRPPTVRQGPDILSARNLGAGPQPGQLGPVGLPVAESVRLLVGQHVPDGGAHLVGQVAPGHDGRMALAVVLVERRQVPVIRSCAIIAAFIVIQASLPSASFFMRPCRALSPDWQTPGQGPRNETICPGPANRPMPSTDSAASRAPKASNPGRAVISRAGPSARRTPGMS